MSHKT